MLRHPPEFLAATCCALLALALPVRGLVIFEFDYSASTEFLDSAGGDARRAALDDAGRALGALFEHDATVQMRVTSSNDPDDSTLASATSADLELAEDFFGFSPGVVQHKILSGIDGNGLEADGEVDINFGQAWDLDDDVAFDLFDFKATMIHELMHTVGFMSLIFQDGTDAFDTPPGNPGVWSPFDAYITGPDGIPIINETSSLNGSAWVTHGIGGASPAGGLFFSGPSARAANNGHPVGLYSPSTWEEGSSGSHLDDDNPALARMMMLALTDPGPSTRELSAIEKAILIDLGYTLTDSTAAAGLVVTIQRADLGVSLSVSGPEGAYALRRSTDLQSWEVIATLTIAPPGEITHVVVDLADDGRQAYFTVSPE